MANLTPKKIVLSEINNGQQIENGDGVQPNLFNAPVEASAYAQALATNQPNTENIGNFGIPKVGIEEINGVPRFKFENLQGATVKDIRFVGQKENGDYEFAMVFDNDRMFNFLSPIGPTVTFSSATATVDNSIGIPSVEVTIGGTESEKTLHFAFSNLKGDTYELTDIDKEEIAKITSQLAEPYVDDVVETVIQRQMEEATKGFTVVENVSNLVENNISFTKNYVSYNKLNDYVTLRLVGTANELNATSSVNVATMSDIFAPNAETQKEVAVGGVNTIVSVGTDGFIKFSSDTILNGNFDIEITWELPSDSIIGHLQLNSAETVNINSVVKKGYITTIRLDCTFIERIVQHSYSGNTKDVVFNISDAFGVVNNAFLANCDYTKYSTRNQKWYNYNYFNSAVNFEIKNGECFAVKPEGYKTNYDNGTTENVYYYLSAIHNLELQFNNDVPSTEFTITSGSYGRITDNGSYADNLYVYLDIKIQYMDTSDMVVGGTYPLGEINPVYAPKTKVEISTIQSHVTGIISINTTGSITFKPSKNIGGVSGANDSFSLSYKYK